MPIQGNMVRRTTTQQHQLLLPSCTIYTVPSILLVGDGSTAWQPPGGSIPGPRQAGQTPGCPQPGSDCLLFFFIIISSSTTKILMAYTASSLLTHSKDPHLGPSGSNWLAPTEPTHEARHLHSARMKPGQHKPLARGK